MTKVNKTAEEWKSLLSAVDYHITREKGTEPAFQGDYYDLKETGQYLCKCCKTALFDSKSKYDSGSGWPSFYQPGEGSAIDEHEDNTRGMRPQARLRPPDSGKCGPCRLAGWMNTRHKI